MKLIAKSFNVFSNKEKKTLITIFLVSVFCAILEFLSIGLLAPTLYFIFDSTNSQFKFLNYDFQNLKVENIVYFFFLTILLKNITLIFFNRYLIKFSEYLRLNFASKLFNSYLSMSFLEYTKKNSAIMVRNLFDDVLGFSSFLFSSILILTDMLIFLAIIIFLSIYDFQTTFYGLFLIMIIGLGFYFLFNKKLKYWGIEKQNYTGKFLKTTIQSLNSLKEIKIYNKEKFVYESFFHNHKRAVDLNFLSRFISMLPRFIFEMSAVIAIVIIFFFTKNLNLENQEIIVFLGVYGYSFYRLLPTANKLITNFSNIKYRTASTNKVIDEINLAQQFDYNKKLQKDKINLNKLENLSLENLSFKYPNSKQILKNLNFEIKKNQIIGIFGDSGSGKSTLINILLGLIQPDEGKIRINGNNLNLENNTLFGTIGCVFQSIDLWDDTIKNNIALGVSQKELNTEKLLSAIEKSRLDKFVKSLPNGLDTIIGERGAKLSGGQKQRLGLARALYYRPKILILDEATNSLDKNVETDILDDVTNLKKDNLSLIIVSHDTDLLKKYADLMFELKQGNLKKI